MTGTGAAIGNVIRISTASLTPCSHKQIVQQERPLEWSGRAFEWVSEHPDHDRTCREFGQRVAQAFGSGERVILEPALAESRRRRDVVVGSQRDREEVAVVPASVGDHAPPQWIDPPDRLLAELDPLFGEVAVMQQRVVRRLPAEQNVQLRESEVERLVLVYESDANRVPERVRQPRRQLEAREAGTDDHHVPFHRLFPIAGSTSSAVLPRPGSVLG